MASPLMRADRSNVSVPSGGMLMDAAQHPPKGPAAHPPLPDRKSGTMMQSKRTGSTRVVVLAPTGEVHPVPQAYKISTMRSALVRSIPQWNPFLRLGCSSLAGRSTLPVTVHAQRASSYLSTTPSLERREASPPPPTPALLSGETGTHCDAVHGLAPCFPSRQGRHITGMVPETHAPCTDGSAHGAAGPGRVPGYAARTRPPGVSEARQPSKALSYLGRASSRLSS